MNVPPRLRELHAALNRVGDVATDRVDLSRLQLALRGLESEEPLVRVAGEFLCLFFSFLFFFLLLRDNGEGREWRG